MIIDEHNQKAIEMFLDTADPGGNASFWIGLTDLFHEGTFVWINGESASFTNWSPSQPDNAGKREHFAHVYSKSAQRRWNDYNNEKTDIFALCQFNF